MKAPRSGPTSFRRLVNSSDATLIDVTKTFCDDDLSFELVHRAPGDRKKLKPVARRTPTLPLGNVRRHGDRRLAHLRGKTKVLAPRKVLGRAINQFGKVNGLLPHTKTSK